MGELLDTLRRINGFWAGVALLGLFAAAATAAGLLQRRLTRRLAASPGSRVSWLALEVWFSLPGILWLPFHGLVRGVQALPRLLRKRKGKAPAGEAGEPAPPAEALLVATLGPSFLLSGLAMAALHLLAVASEPLLRSRLGLSPGYPAWQYLFLGWREELAWYIPLGRFPFLAGLLAALFWLSLWWWGSRLIRLAAIGHLGRNLAAERETPEPLGLWRTGCGAGFLAAPDASYRRWAGWLVATGAALLAAAWLSLGGRPYRVEPSHFAVAAVLWLSWAIHLRLRGLDRPATSPEPAAPEPEAVAAGWPELAAYLREHLQVVVPPPFETPRRIEPLPLAEADPASASVLSPLLIEVLPTPRRLTTFQRAVLADLSLQGFVHLDPPPAAGELTLAGLAGEAVEDRSGLRSRNLLVIAPEGSGKSTLALLAAANHALVHTRATLVVTRDDEDEERVYTAFRGALEPSTLRFSVRVRRFGEDLMADLTQGILPDVVICSLHHLTVGVLEAPETFAPFLRNLGLVVVDDVEEFAGPVEIHAQLAFRRLTLRLQRLTGVRELGERSAPQMLILAGDSMHDLAAWARGLCGVDAVVRRFTRAAGEGGSHHQLFFRLADFRTAARDRFGAAELIEACERLEIPWHYRSCGDGRRRLGRAKLPLREEPKQFRPSPEDACVVLLEGPWSAVRRERNRLRRAGARFRRHPGDEAAPEIIAVLTLADPDEEMAFTQLDKRFSLAGPLETLPWPVVRPPSGRTVESHLAAELTRSWLETAQVIEVFGGGAAVHLRRLAAAGFLLSEERVEVDPRANRYQRELYVRALAGATAEESGLLPEKVVQVERVSERSVAVRDRTRLTVLARVDAEVAGLLYYPGRIFADARGTFVVVGQEADVLVDPLLTDDLSSPRRLLFLEAEGPGFHGPDPVLFGRYPIGVSLLPVTVSALHLATFRLAPGSRAVRQRIVIEPPRRVRTPPLATVALALHPNPTQAAQGAPILTLREARLLAATLRAVLPSLVRGAEDGLAVALRVAAEDPAPDHPLGPEDGLFLFDLDTGGNGIARALHRDGIELLLRLCRLMVERVLDPGGLLRLHDHWADEREILVDEPGSGEATGWEANEALRHGLLSWLDSRLRPEGGDAAAPSAGPGSGSEPGEGDPFDLGRCWFSPDGAVTDLVWARHRWFLPEGREAILDVGFDRKTVALSRWLAEDDQALASYQETLAARLKGEPAWGAPLPVRFLDPSGETRTSDDGCKAEPLSAFHAFASAVYAQSHAALAPLAEALRERSGAEGGLPLATYLSRFVQGIPYSEPRSVRGGLRPPVSTLLYRLGDCDSKALLLALLLARCGFASGLFVSFAERHAMAAVALDGAAPPEPAPLWAEDGTRLFVPVECTVCSPVGAARVDQPATWAFLPFAEGLDLLGLDWDTLSPWDRAEHEGRF